MGKKEDFTFDGFEPANTTPIPDVLFDVLLTKLTGAELKVLLYIMRRTWGFKKDTDAISLSQFQDGITTRDGKVLDKGCGIKRRETICQALETLEKMGCITSQKERHNDGDNATTIYSIHFKDVVSKPDYPSFKTGLPVVSQSDYGSPVSGLPLVSKPDSQLNSNTRNSTQETVRQESSVTSAIAGSDTPATDNLIDFKKATDGRMKAVTPSHSQADRGNDEDISLQETQQRIPAVPKQTPAAGVPAIPPHGSDTGAQALSVSPSRDAAQRTATGRGGAVQASIPKRPRGRVTQATLKTPEELALDERCRALQQRINDWRGYPLEGKGQIINERKSIRTLVERYSDERIERDYLYLFNRHWKWSKPDNRYHIGAYVILSEAESIEQELKAKQSPNGNAKRDENIGVSGLPRLKPLGEVKYG